MACSLSAPPKPTAIASRPKLSLQTSSLPRTFGSSSTGLSFSFAAGSSASPTVRNTFRNAYDVATPSSATASPSRTVPTPTTIQSSGLGPRFSTSKPPSPYVTTNNSNNNTNNNNNNNPFTYNYRSPYPYQQPLGVRSILRNSPLEPTAHRRSGSISATSVNGAAGGAGTRRVFFPAKKQVSYRYPLEEIIRTERYTVSHFDLVLQEEEKEEQEEGHEQRQKQGHAKPETEHPTPEQEDDDSDYSTLSLSETSGSSEESSPDDGQHHTSSSLSKTERKKRRTMRLERQVRAVALLDGLQADDAYAASTPQTPRQRRVKRRREWKWTLGSANPNNPQSAQNNVVSSLEVAQQKYTPVTTVLPFDFDPAVSKGLLEPTELETRC
ncbi:hypothetical protein N7510_008821 [Penicillium lagena]|uniref:uncharacterized protein n=1 Tax=Penicillium lagena TaxID=94218 RepID=UPI0025422069|nr:uncharacterized protein N7510_008821 [Penicillium lagena]KAJ5606040.1 hypothetical protein N7510_008821 [Penicillium lagena]